MKRILLLLSLLMLTVSSITCSGNDDEPVMPSPETKIPQELIGTWKVNKYGWLDEPEMAINNDKGYFIRFNTDNTVEYKDMNATFKGTAKLIQQDNTWMDFPGQNRSLRFINSQKFPGQKEFIITYDSSTFNDSFLIGTKQ